MRHPSEHLRPFFDALRAYFRNRGRQTPNGWRLSASEPRHATGRSPAASPGPSAPSSPSSRPASSPMHPTASTLCRPPPGCRFPLDPPHRTRPARTSATAALRAGASRSPALPAPCWATLPSPRLSQREARPTSRLRPPPRQPWDWSLLRPPSRSRRRPGPRMSRCAILDAARGARGASSSKKAQSSAEPGIRIYRNLHLVAFVSILEQD